MHGYTEKIAISALQLAKLSGFSPIITTASLKHRDNLKALGATHILDRKLSRSVFSDEVKKITGEKPINYVLDAISLPDTQQMGIDILSTSGQMAVVLDPSVEIPEDKKVIHAYGILRMTPAHIELLETLYHDEICGWLEKGVIKVRTALFLKKWFNQLKGHRRQTMSRFSPMVWPVFLLDWQGWKLTRYPG